MKSIGMVRCLDALGRLVIPVETRRIMGLTANDPLEMFMEGTDALIIKKYGHKCVICGEREMLKLKTFKDKDICVDCLNEIKEK